jgi:hypothetical protein
MTLIAVQPATGPILRLWVPEGWDYFVHQREQFRRSPQDRRIEQWVGTCWRPVTVLQVLEPAA